MLWRESRKRLVFILIGFAILFSAVAVPTAMAAGISVSPSSGWIGTTFTVTADGFRPLELVNTWVGRPDGTVFSTGTLMADDTGAVEFSVTPWVGWQTGEYTAVARNKSGLTVSTKFTVYGPEKPAPAPRTEIRLGDPSGLTFFYSGAHYTPNELVAVWYRNPNGVYITLSNVYADPWGNVWFPITIGANWQFGGYDFAARGVTSKHTTEILFSFFDGKITDLRGTDPVQGQPLFFTFTANGFIAGEKISIWVGQPDGTDRFLSLATAAADGSVSYSTIIPPGLPQGQYKVVAYGWSSHRVFYRTYDVSF